VKAREHSTIAVSRLLCAMLACAAIVTGGCASNGSGSGTVHGSVYVGTGYYDSWGWGPCCYHGGPPVVVGPPPVDRPDFDRPVKPSQPIANAPSPRPAMRAGGGGRRR
jgi:hypothetical protein